MVARRPTVRSSVFKITHLAQMERRKNSVSPIKNSKKITCPEAESNHRHEDFQSSALPTELSGQEQTGFNSTRREYFVSRKATSSSIDKGAWPFLKEPKPPEHRKKRYGEMVFFFPRCSLFALSIRQASKEAVRRIRADPPRQQNKRRPHLPCRTCTQASSRSSPRTRKELV